MAEERHYWWVNHSQTIAQEVGGNYLWSPKVDQDGKRNRSYDYMTEVRPGDIVFSYADKMVRAVGLARSSCYFYPQPEEFGKVGQAWDKYGWRVDVAFQRLSVPITPRAALTELMPLLPSKYSPINSKGYGNQKIYLAKISMRMAVHLAAMLPIDVRASVFDSAQDVQEAGLETELRGLVEWEDFEESKIRVREDIPQTTRMALVKARRGQGIFKANVHQFERSCRVTTVENPSHLVASHIKPWRVATDDERLSGSNGLLLTPSADHLFDRGYISFEDSGELIVSPVADKESLAKMGALKLSRTTLFNSDQKHFLDFHRRVVLLTPGTEAMRRLVRMRSKQP